MSNIVSKLTYRVAENIYEEYRQKHLSFNLANTMETITTLGDIGYVYIPAPRYSIDFWKKTGVILYTYEGSYAMSNQLYGGFSKKHVNFVDRAVVNAIEQELGDSVDYEITFKY